MAIRRVDAAKSFTRLVPHENPAFHVNFGDITLSNRTKLPDSEQVINLFMIGNKAVLRELPRTPNMFLITCRGWDRQALAK